jgi:hypothetical protein
MMCIVVREPKGNDMKPVIRLACPLALAIALALPSAPANAQIAGDQMMSQFAPMIGMMKKKIGKKRFGRLMQTVGPMMTSMGQQSSGAGGISSLGGISSIGGFSSLGDLGSLGGLGNYGFGGFGGRNYGGGSRY